MSIVRGTQFNGLDPNGLWFIDIYHDTVAQSGGTVARGWSLTITAKVRR